MGALRRGNPLGGVSHLVSSRAGIKDDNGGVSWVFWSCGASVGFLPRHDGDLREPLVHTRQPETIQEFPGDSRPSFQADPLEHRGSLSSLFCPHILRLYPIVALQIRSTHPFPRGEDVPA